MVRGIRAGGAARAELTTEKISRKKLADAERRTTVLFALWHMTHKRPRQPQRDHAYGTAPLLAARLATAQRQCHRMANNTNNERCAM